jgi:fibronectin type 3 domain-containing protein
MTTRVRVAGLSVAALLLSGCGYIGDPLPPALNLPVKITDLRAVQQADQIVIDFTISGATTENLQLKRLGPPDLQINGESFPVPEKEPGPFHVILPAARWVGQTITVHVRANNGRGRYSVWSNDAVLNVLQPLDTPSEVKAENSANGIRLTWKSAAVEGQTYRIFRKSPEGEKTLTSDKPELFDAPVQYGQRYQYQVQALVGSTESAVSPPITFTPEDKFPPVAPAALVVLVGVDSIELSWERNTEDDVKGYRVYRSVDGGPLQPVSDPEGPSYSDKAVQTGKKYRYEVTALDRSGNESPHSAPVEIAGP